MPASTSSRIRSGSSVRGLSDVAMAMSASRTAISPIGARLPRSRSPPAPNTTMTRPPPAVTLADRSRARAQCVGRVRVVAQHHARIDGNALHPAWHLRRGGQALGHGRATARSSPTAHAATPSALATLNRPSSGSAHRIWLPSGVTKREARTARIDAHVTRDPTSRRLFRVARERDAARCPRQPGPRRIVRIDDRKPPASAR